ncbi:sensor domain-containing diguanylate cyclase [Desulfomicrobium escambiense]|uniref:sensor domain-containing diguanylate cyclase n=1 Tax=Desulfomicrobium escambiense TaxID=29503 RepID=UPI000A065977|nr:sensor domain-containing diguanylate cyclase [Desulfomicrobium escambiense]
MSTQSSDWRMVAEKQSQMRKKAEDALVEMRRFLFDYFYLLGPDPIRNIDVVVTTLGKVLGSDVAFYNRLEGGVLRTWSIDHEPPGFKREDAPEGHICYDMTISHRDPSNMKAVVLNDLEGTEWATLDANVRQYGLKSYLGFPIQLEGRVVGSLCVVDTRKREYTEIEQYIIEAFSSAIRLEEERLLTQNRLAAANAALEEKNRKIEEMALTDFLTGLPNRRAIIDCLDTEIAALNRRRHAAQVRAVFPGFSLVMCDVDNFKDINDTFGHVCGDEVLKVISTLLTNSLRAQDRVARWGGEEFVMLLKDTDAPGAAVIAERIRKAIADTPFSCGGESFRVTATFGVSACENPCMTINDCVHVADKALYVGKDKGRNQVVVLPLETSCG